MRGTAQRVTDHFECYKIAVTSGTPKVCCGAGCHAPGSIRVDDREQPVRAGDAKKPALVCVPALTTP